MKPFMRFSALSLFLLVFTLGGCKSLLKKRVPVTAPSDSAPVALAPPPTPSASPSSTPVAVPLAGAVVADDDAVPAPEDFEDEAFEKVTASNFKAEFARLQKEVAAK